jgi:CSLREA domain-containing protein
VADQFGTDPAQCSLREAVQSANVDADFGGCHRQGSGPDVVLVHAGSTYSRTLAGSGDDNATGDLDLSSSMAIRPATKQGRATIDAAGLSRVLDVFNGAHVSISRVNLVRGATQVGDADIGGGALVASGSQLALSDATVRDNVAGQPNGVGQGGGISSSGVLSLTRVTVANNRTAVTNSASNGGGVEILAGKATLDRVTIDGNGASNIGGGLENEDADVAVRDSTFRGNKAGSGGGGGIINRNRMTLNRVTIAGNSSGYDGAGFYSETSSNTGGQAKLTNVTITGNTASRDGGGIAIYTGSVLLDNATVAGNTADGDADGTGHGGGISGAAAFQNSIVAQNVDRNAADAAPDCYAGPYSLGHSLIGTPTNCGFTSTSPNIVGKDPKLGPLQRNGGPTATRALKIGSPAINRGSPAKPGSKPFSTGACAANDQRGIVRPQGSACDIGAFEFDVSPNTQITHKRVNQAKDKASFRFSSSEAASTFLCKLDKKPFRPCHSPKTYRHLKAGKHKFRVKARDGTGHLDLTPAVARFKIKP